MTDYDKSRRTAALAVECFQSRVVLDFRCSPNGPPVSAYEYLLCRYYQDLHADSSGAIDRSASAEAKARIAVDSLKAFLAMMLGDFADQGYSVSELIEKWTPQLRQFDRASLIVSEFISKQLGGCYKRAHNHVEHER